MNFIWRKSQPHLKHMAKPDLSFIYWWGKTYKGPHLKLCWPNITYTSPSYIWLLTHKVTRILVDISPELKTDKLKVRKFNKSWYDRKRWLTSCPTRKKPFCFPFLLFKGQSIWSKNGATKRTATSTNQHMFFFTVYFILLPV